MYKLLKSSDTSRPMANSLKTSKLMSKRLWLRIPTSKTDLHPTLCMCQLVVSSPSANSMRHFSSSMWNRSMSNFWRCTTRTTPSNLSTRWHSCRTQWDLPNSRSLRPCPRTNSTASMLSPWLTSVKPGKLCLSLPSNHRPRETSLRRNSIWNSEATAPALFPPEISQEPWMKCSLWSARVNRKWSRPSTRGQAIPSRSAWWSSRLICTSYSDSLAPIHPESMCSVMSKSECMEVSSNCLSSPKPQSNLWDTWKSKTEWKKATWMKEWSSWRSRTLTKTLRGIPDFRDQMSSKLKKCSDQWTRTLMASTTSEKSSCTRLVKIKAKSSSTWTWGSSMKRQAQLTQGPQDSRCPNKSAILKTDGWLRLEQRWSVAIRTTKMFSSTQWVLQTLRTSAI